MRRLSKAVFVLPTLFTLTSVLLGVIAILNSSEQNFQASALCILFAWVFDSIDGRVARMTRTQSQFGVQIDSLADVISFGVAPAVLVYHCLLQNRVQWGFFDVGVFVVFLYLSAGAIRLARYNVEAERKPGPVKQFTGLPIPAAAGCLAGLVLGLDAEGLGLPVIATLSVLFSLTALMVSTVKFRKRVNIRSADTQILLLMLVGLLSVTWAVRPHFVALVFFAFYVFVGLAEGTIIRLKRLQKRARRHDSKEKKVPGK